MEKLLQQLHDIDELVSNMQPLLDYYKKTGPGKFYADLALEYLKLAEKRMKLAVDIEKLKQQNREAQISGLRGRNIDFFGEVNTDAQNAGLRSRTQDPFIRNIQNGNS
jgi:hypothetical protein